jgi:hypothetical protein
MRIFVRLLIAVAPLLLALMFAWRMAQNGDKDIVLAIPPVVWSLTFLVSFVVLWWRKLTPGRSIGISAAIATGLVVISTVLLFVWSSWLRLW